MALMQRSFFLMAGAGLLAALSIVAAVAGPGVTRSENDTASAATKISSGDRVDGRKRTRDVTVDAPYTHVEAGRRVRVEAPYVDVNTDRRRVRVQAPFADVDVRW